MNTASSSSSVMPLDQRIYNFYSFIPSLSLSQHNSNLCSPSPSPFLSIYMTLLKVQNFSFLKIEIFFLSFILLMQRTDSRRGRRRRRTKKKKKARVGFGFAVDRKWLMGVYKFVSDCYKFGERFLWLYLVLLFIYGDELVCLLRLLLFVVFE